MEKEEYIENLKYLEIEEISLPKRKTYTYIYIENIEDYEYTNSIAYEMLRRNAEFKELTKKPFTEKTENWISKILELGLDPRINFFPDFPDNYYNIDRFFYESWDSHTIDDIKNGLQKLITHFFNKNQIFTLTDENNTDNINSYKKIDGVKLINILENYPSYYIPCLITNDFIKIDTSDMIRFQQISKKIPLRILEKDFLETLNFEDTKYKYTQLLPFYSRPELSFPESNIANIPINLNLDDDEITAYILKAKEEFKEQSLNIKHPLELIGNEFEKAKKPKSEKELPDEKHKRKIAVADAFFVYDLFKILEPYFKEKTKTLRTKRNIEIEKLKEELKYTKNYKEEITDHIKDIKERYYSQIKQYSTTNLQFTISALAEISIHKTERYFKYMKEYIDNKRYKELITGKKNS